MNQNRKELFVFIMMILLVLSSVVLAFNDSYAWLAFLITAFLIK